MGLFEKFSKQVKKTNNAKVLYPYIEKQADWTKNIIFSSLISRILQL